MWTGMAAALLPDTLWDLVEPFLPSPPRQPMVGDREFPIARVLRALSSSFAAAFPGRCSRRNLGAGPG